MSVVEEKVAWTVSLRSGITQLSVGLCLAARAINVNILGTSLDPRVTRTEGKWTARASVSVKVQQRSMASDIPG